MILYFHRKANKHQDRQTNKQAIIWQINKAKRQHKNADQTAQVDRLDRRL